MSAMDELFDLAHDQWSCGCRDCGRAGLQWGPTKDRKGYWVSFVLVGPKGHLSRPERDGKTLEIAARSLLDLDLEEAA